MAKKNKVTMDKYGVAGTLMTYSNLAANARNVKHLEEIVERLRDELSPRKAKFKEAYRN